MGGALRKTMVYLGLAEEEERYYADDGDDEDLIEDPADDYRGERTSDRHVDLRDAEAESERRAQVTPITRGHVGRVLPAPMPQPELHRITTIHPRTYNEAKTIGEAFRAGTPVIMNLGDMEDADAKRLVDFAAGLVFGLHGALERVTSKVFLLSPANVEVAAAEKVRVPERTFFNQS
ncbi:MAG: cell division inhibitor SepF [Actinomycetota bacterium]|nr:cell division inhibitor SepF [Actinomycetota bacterium]